jgi:hypothetical protein
VEVSRVPLFQLCGDEAQARRRQFFLFPALQDYFFYTAWCEASCWQQKIHTIKLFGQYGEKKNDGARLYQVHSKKRPTDSQESHIKRWGYEKHHGNITGIFRGN